MKIKNKTAGHAGIACFSFALKGNRAGSPHFKIVRFKWWEHVTIDNEYVKVAVRVASSGKYYARSLYVLNHNRVHNFIKKGTLKRVEP